MSMICKQCGKETGPDIDSGCDESYKPNCAWYVQKDEDASFTKVYDENDFVKAKGEPIKNNVEDGENFIGI